jgi:putative phosphoribosyl transferase
MADAKKHRHSPEAAVIPAGTDAIAGDLILPDDARGLVLFAHGSGSSRFSPRNRYVAQQLHQGALGTLMLDLLTEREEAEDLVTSEFRFDIPLLAQRLVAATDWVTADASLARLPLGYFGASTGAAAALIAAANRPREVDAVVSRGGRPDLGGDALPRVEAPTLLVVGGNDAPVIELNRRALAQMQCPRRLEIVPGATHLFEEPGALDEVAGLAQRWFIDHFGEEAAMRAQ